MAKHPAPLRSDASAGHPLVRNEEGLTPQWLTAVLRASGVLRSSSVTALTAEPIGNGLIGLNLRLCLEYDAAEPGAPKTLVAKMASTNAESRASGSSLKLYLREVSFYQELAPRIENGVARTYFADITDDGQEYCLLFEDMAPARMGDQLTGCSLADARAAMVTAAELAAPFWGDASLNDAPWMDRKMMTDMYCAALPPFMPTLAERFKHFLEPGVLEVAQEYADNIERYYALHSRSPFTVSHQDYRLDNMMFDARNGEMPVAVLDWQTLVPGPAALDASYFVGAGLLLEDRRANEESLARLYYDELIKRGVTGFSWEQCWHDYRLHAAHGLDMGIVGAAITTSTERGDKMLSTMINRHAQQMIDLGTMDLIRNG